MISVRSSFQLARQSAVWVLLTTYASLANCQDQSPDQPIVEDISAVHSGSEVDDGILQERYVSADLLAVEQLILMLSNRPNQQGAPQEALVFLGRSQQRGWEAIGVTDQEEFRAHWRSVASRLLAPYAQSDLSADKKEKIDLAVELSIAQFIRLFSSLRIEFLEQPDQKARLALLAGDNRYEQLRQLGREGLFKEDSLVGRVVDTVLSENPGQH